MRVVFMGTPDFALPSLKALVQAPDCDVVAVFTRPDAVSGRGKQLVPCPVKLAALAAGITTYQPDSFKNEEAIQTLKELSPDLIVVAAYGVILPQDVLDIPTYGCLNVHGSLLPEYRGAAPIQRVILDGKEIAGVCIMRMEAGLDTGDYCSCASVATAGMDYSQLSTELSNLGAKILIEALPRVVDGSIEWIKQDDAKATYAHKIEKPETLLSPELTAVTNLRRVRASSAQAPAKCIICGKGVTVETAQIALDIPKAEPGAVTISKKGVFLHCAQGALNLLAIKPDGKKRMDGRAWALGLRDVPLEWEALPAFKGAE